MKKNIKKVFIVATEQSGDDLGSSLIKNLNKNSRFDFQFYGIGGDKMINEKDLESFRVSELAHKLNTKFYITSI